MTKGKAFAFGIIAVLALALLGAAMQVDMKAGIDGISTITRSFFEFGGDGDTPSIAPAGPIIETFPQEQSQ